MLEASFGGQYQDVEDLIGCSIDQNTASSPDFLPRSCPVPFSALMSNQKEVDVE